MKAPEWPDAVYTPRWQLDISVLYCNLLRMALADCSDDFLKQYLSERISEAERDIIQRTAEYRKEVNASPK